VAVVAEFGRVWNYKQMKLWNYKQKNKQRQEQEQATAKAKTTAGPSTQRCAHRSG